MSLPKRELLIVCDAGPLIMLAKVGRLDLLRSLADEVWIPAAVWQEVVVNGVGHPEVSEIVAKFAPLTASPDAALEAAFRLQVDAGEAAALALAARHPHACLLMDDARGRTVAKLSGLRCIGTLGWLVRGKQAGLVPALRPLFEKLREAGWYIDERLVSAALKAARE